jgi:hypothetical protein
MARSHRLNQMPNTLAQTIYPSSFFARNSAANHTSRQAENPLGTPLQPSTTPPVGRDQIREGLFIK